MGHPVMWGTRFTQVGTVSASWWLDGRLIGTPSPLFIVKYSKHAS
jgi:hypothetical protein